MENERLQNEMNRIKLFQCEDVQAGDMCHYYYFPEKVGIKQAIKSLLRIAYYSVFSFCSCSIQGTPSTLSLFSNSYRLRQDHRKAFDNVTELIDNQIIVTPSKRKFSLMHIFSVYLPFVWIFQLRKTSASFIERMMLSVDIYSAHVDYCFVRRYLRKKQISIKYLLTFCDVMPIDSLFVQKFMPQGIIAVTLQHGTFNIKSNAWAYSASRSDYFLTESPATADAGRRAGYKGNIIPVGSPHQLKDKIEYPPELPLMADTVGIIMNSDRPGSASLGEKLRADNIEMLTIVQAYCRSSGKKCLIKYHPANHPEEYSKYIDHAVAKTYGTEISIDDFSKLIDICIVSASSVFNTMLKKWIPVFLFVRKGFDPETFPKTDWLKFSTVDELSAFVESIQTPEYWTKMRDCRSYNLCDGCYRDNYIGAFQKIGIDTVK